MNFVKDALEDMLIDANPKWNQTLGQIWESGRSVILSYKFIELEYEFPSTVFKSLHQCWENNQNLTDLKEYFTT